MGKKFPAVAVLAVAAFVFLTAADCSKVTEPYNDAPRTSHTNKDAADIITMPDGFSNMASKCDGPNRVYVAYHGDNPYASVFVVKDDPRCVR